MSGAIYGSIGPVPRTFARSIGGSLSHRGAHIAHIADEPEVQLFSRQPRSGPRFDVHVGPPVAFCGRILNRDRIVALTGAPAGASDAELIAELYRKYGPHGLQHVSGAYSVALFDAHSDAIVIATDPWAVQTLHFAPVNGGWIFATEQKALLAHVMEPSLDRSTLAYVIATKYMPLHDTLHTEIKALGPGEFARLSTEGCELASYQPFSIAIDRESSEQEFARELREQLLSATLRIVEGHQRIAVGLSGGLDSVVTLGALRQSVSADRLCAYTAAFDERDPLLASAAQTARRFGVRHEAVVITPDELVDALPELIWRMEDPLAREEMAVYHAIAQRAAADCSLVMYGHMADVLFAGMPRHLLIKAAAELPLLKRPITEFYDYTQTGAQPRSAVARLALHVQFKGRYPPPPRVLGDAGGGNDKGLQIAPEQPLNHALLKAATAPSEAGAMERLHAWAGVEMGSIFHALEVGRVAFRIPDDLKIRGRRRKHILREAALGIVPEDCTQRRKDLIRLPVTARLAVHRFAASLLEQKAVRAGGVFDAAELEQLLHQTAMNAHANQDFYNLWSVVLSELWRRAYLERTPEDWAWNARVQTGWGGRTHHVAAR